MRLVPPINGATIGVYPRSALITVEARLAALLAGHVDDHRLMPPSLLPEGAERARTVVESLGVGLLGPITVRRADLASELCFDHGADGMAFMNASQRGVHLPRLRQVPYHALGDARLESIVWATEKGRQTRIKLYDAGARHQTHAVGERLRLEREHRWSGSAAPTAEQVLRVDLAALYSAPLKAWLRRATPIYVCPPTEAISLLFEQVRRGERTRRSAESLSAKVNMLAYGADLLAPHDRRRRVKDLREAGIALDRAGDNRAGVLDIREPFSALVARWNAS